MNNRFAHWQKVYEKTEQEFSWYQSYPETSVKLIQESRVCLSDPIIDIGGGDSHLVDALLALGYSNLSVLDISARAIERAKERLGELSQKIKWIVSDVLAFKPAEKFAVWHDRATFHFLVEEANVVEYRENVATAIRHEGKFILGAFSINGPSKCSGLPVLQYSESKMIETFGHDFQKEKCFEEEHQTPFNTQQLFQFCLFSKT
ncbi:MAG: class I SAM-dependent methyltransferase [Bacteroidetes bacterium]|nr:class I SAM-dependent methyltransferase [Bacteroidota bacterium]MBS1977820.1 class I SAM-dependent methyltransferase [Bacteroidota bacterium]